MTKKAYAINAIRLGGVQIPASTKDNPSVFDVDADVFNRLLKLEAVRVPTKDEIAIAKIRAAETDGTTIVEESEQEEAEVKETPAPSSGAKADPNSRPKGAAAKTEPDLGV